MESHATESNHKAARTIQCIGIDFGTYKCAMFKFDATKGEARVIRNSEGEEATRSLVSYEDKEILVGTPVLDMLEDPELCKNVITEVKLHLADGISYPVSGKPKPVQVATEIFRKLKRDAEASGEFDGEITHAVVTYPVAFTRPEQDMLSQAAQDAGFREVHLLKEPEAAALAFAKEGKQPGNCLLVYDLGAGTFDLAIVTRNAQTGSYHSTQLFDGLRCGGNDFDRLLYDYCDALFIQQHGRSMSMEEGTELKYLDDCRKKKENLSTQRQVPFSWIVPNGEKKSIPFKPSLDRVKFEVLIRETVGETIKHTQALVELAHASNHDVDTIVLIGGSSYIPLVKDQLQEALSIEPQPWHNRHRAVALGAAYCANDLWGTDYQIRQYRQAIEEARRESAWNEVTRAHLASLHETLALTDDQATHIERDVLGSTVNETIQDIERRVNEQELQAALEDFKKYAQQASASGRSLTFLLVGRSGVGKSSSINSLMDKEVAPIGHHDPTTMTVESYPHEISGIKFTIFDTPGLCDQLEEEGNDERYLELIRTKVPRIDCLWYVTNLNERRFYPDEKRAIQLISQGCGKDIWQHAIIVCTHANAVNYDNTIPRITQFENAYNRRTTDIRQEIAKSVGTAIAHKIPSVAIDNTTRTTPDGKEWLGKLYLATSTRLSDEAFAILTGGMSGRFDFDSQTSKHAPNDNKSTYTGTGTSRIPVGDSKQLLERIASVAVNVVNVMSSAYNSAKNWVKGLFK